MILADAAAVPTDPTTIGVILAAVVTLAKALEWAFARIDKMSEEKKASANEAAGKVSPEMAALIAALPGRHPPGCDAHEERIRRLEVEMAEARGRRQRLTGSHPRVDGDE